MEHIKSFSIKRIFLLMQKTLYENAKSVIIGLTTVFGFFAIILFISALNGDSNAWSNLQGFYIAGLFIAGLFISGMAFTNFRNKEKTLSYLTLPASILEKFISEWLLTTLVFIITYTIIFYVFNFLLLILGNSLNIEVNIINVLNNEIIKLVPNYLIIQSIFLAGAAAFKKAPLFKTLFTAFLFSIFLTIYLSVLAYFLKGTFETFSFNNNGMNMNGMNSSYHPENHWLIETVKYLYYYITAPVYWLYTYYKLKEKEI